MSQRTITNCGAAAASAVLCISGLSLFPGDSYLANLAGLWLLMMAGWALGTFIR